MNFDYFKKYAINDLAKIDTMIQMNLKDIRERSKILVVDDDAVCRLHENLKLYGYTDVRLDRDIQRITDVKDYHLILCDINGIGARLAEEGKSLKYQGLTVAEDIKKMFPLIKVISYSAKKDFYEGNYIAETVVDQFFDKDEDTNVRNKIIDDTIISYFSPVDSWKIFRDAALKKGVSIHDIAKAETYYVKCVLNKKDFKVEDIVYKSQEFEKFGVILTHLSKIVKIYNGLT